MTAPRPRTPSQGLYNNNIPTPHDPSHLHRGYGGSQNIDANDFASTPGNPNEASPLSHSLQPNQRLGRFEEDFDAHTRGSSILADGDLPQRSASRASTLNQGAAPSRSGTLKKKSSVRRTGSLKRSGSRKSLHAGSIRGVSIEDEERLGSKHNSVFYTPVPTSGSPTEILANRFQAWRKLLKDLITYFREVANSYEHRGKALLKVSNVINNTNAPSVFSTEGGINEANRILRDFHKQSVSEANKARDIENEVIAQLNGLRADLQQKIKEIKSLSGDFKNSVEKEKEGTRKAVATLEEALALIDTDPQATAGKGDPYVVRLGVDRQIERQIDEENYLHRAYLNLENSGRELESIVVGEIQKAYNALASILKRDADEMYTTIERLRSGPIGMPRDLEWNQFVENDPHFVNPRIPLRRLEEIEYPGKHHPATVEVRAGMLERKSKYLKSYTPGWYVLSPTHIHEFKSADRIYTQPPVMSLYLPDQKLGSHSQPGSSSHKFVLKGRQTGSMHRGHSWVFRAETYDTMLAWYEDIKTLTEKSGEERNAFVRRHARSMSQGSARSVSTEGSGLEADEADEVPYSANQSMTNEAVRDEPQQRPSPGGRFNSATDVNRHLQAPLSPSSSSSVNDMDLTTASGGLQGSYPGYSQQETHYNEPQVQTVPPIASQRASLPHDTTNFTQSQYQQPPPQTQAPYPTYSNPEPAVHQPQMPAVQQSAYPIPPQETPYPITPIPQQTYSTNAVQQQAYSTDRTPQQPFPPEPVPQQSYPGEPHGIERHDSTYGDWMAPAAGGATVGALGATAAYHHHQRQLQQPPQQESYVPEPPPSQPPNTKPVSTPVQDPIASSSAATDMSLGDTVSTGPSTLNSTPTENKTSFLDGAEAVPAAASASVAPKTSANGGTDLHETGHIFPGIVRHNTDISVSDLYVPGQYPKTPKIGSGGAGAV